MKRSCHRHTVALAQPTWRMIDSVPRPSALSRTIRARSTRLTWPFSSETTITIASDLHNNLLAIPALQRIARGSPLFFVGDPHMAMGDGEVALTAMEGSLRITYRLTVCHPGSGDAPSVAFRYPFGETPDAWVPIGLSDPDGYQVEITTWPGALKLATSTRPTSEASWQAS